MKRLFLLFLPLMCAAVDYEFLTPQAVVVKGETMNPAGVISTQFRWIWAKENALSRDKKGNKLRKPDIT